MQVSRRKCLIRRDLISRFSSSSAVDFNPTRITDPITPLTISKQAFNAHLQSCSSHQNQLKQIHALILTTGISVKNGLLTSLMTSLIALGDLSYARKVFDEMHKPRVFLWNTLIKAYVKTGHFVAAAEIYKQMHRLGVRPDEFTYTFVIKSVADESMPLLRAPFSVVAHVVKYGLDYAAQVRTEMVVMCVRVGEMELARGLFDSMEERDLVAWNALVAACVQSGRASDALDWFNRMREDGVGPDGVTFVSCFSACGQLGCLERGKEIYGVMKRCGIVTNVIVENAWLDMCVKCGCVEMAEDFFEGMSQRNVVSWSSMVMGYAINGESRKALDMFSRMQERGVAPNHVTYLGVLSACSHAGLVDEGKAYFRRMGDKSVQPRLEHYACMVDLLGRSGHLEEAYDFIKRMPVEPDTGVWGALLGACAIHVNVKLGERIADMIFKLAPDSGSYNVLMSNMYAAAGRWNYVDKLRLKMRKRGAKKVAAYSSVEFNGKIHIFFGGNRIHPESSEIYEKLEDLLRQAKSIGYIPNTTSVFHDVGTEEKEITLSHHSEKLAIAFSLLNLKPDSVIRVVKNIRICDDCHNFCKFVSQATKREIIMRDKIRFHHFRNGECSCNNFW